MKINNYIESPKKFDVEELIKFLVKELNITKDFNLSIHYNEKLLNKLSTDNIEFEALLQQSTPELYVLFVRKSKAGLAQIICHEMVHLKQYVSENLKMSSDFRTVIWKGKTYDNSSEYFSREWEVEARALENKLWRKFKKYKKNENNSR